MPAVRKLPPDDFLERLVNEGKSYADIGSMYDVGEQAVYRRMAKLGKTRTRPDYRSVIPWVVAARHNRGKIIDMLRLLGRKNQDLPMDEYDAKRLEEWLSEVKAANVVVCYDRNQGPTPGNPKGGFYYSKRRPTDPPDSVIRPPAPDGSENLRATV